MVVLADNRRVHNEYPKKENVIWKLAGTIGISHTCRPTHFPFLHCSAVKYAKEWGYIATKIKKKKKKKVWVLPTYYC